MERRAVNDKGIAVERPLARLSSFSTVGLFGVTAIVAQVLLLRECLVVVAGNELFIALFFGCWFFGIAAGAAIGSFWKVRKNRLAWIIPAFLSLQVVLLPILMISLRAVRWRWGWPAWQLVPFLPLLRMAAQHLCPFSFLTGLTFPMLCRLVAIRQRASERAIGLVYATESLGSLIGGAAATFLFAVYCEPLTGAWVLGALTAINLVAFLLTANGRARHVLTAVITVFAVGFLAVAASPVRPAIERWSALLRHKAYGEGFEWLAERSTPYQHLALARRGEQFHLLSNGRFVGSFPDPYAIRQRIHLMMSQCEKPRRVLVIGGGENGAITTLLLYPAVEIDYVEIDPAILELVRPHLEEADRRSFDDPRVHIFHEDARSFVRRRLGEIGETSDSLYDAILCNTPDPSTAALNRFYTLDFFWQARRLLGSSGVLVTSISSSVNYFDRELLDYVGSVYGVLLASFGHVLATPGTRAFLFATTSDDRLTSNVERLIARFEARVVRDEGFSPLYFHTAYESDQLGLVNRSLSGSHRLVRPNTDFEPVTYLYHLRLWNRFSGGRSQRLFTLIEHYDWRWAVYSCIGFLVVRLLTLRRWPLTSDRAAYSHACAFLFLTGAAGMVSSIVLLLLFQNFHGSLYRDVGLLVALFMAGLTLGSLAGNRAGRNEKGALLRMLCYSGLGYSLFFLAIETLAIFSMSGGLPGRLLSHSGFFCAAVVVAGLLTGLPFALVGRLAVVCGRDPGRAGGTLENLDHLGACLGAFLTGIVFIPVSGIVATLKMFSAFEFFAAASIAMSCVMLARQRKRR